MRFFSISILSNIFTPAIHTVLIFGQVSGERSLALTPAPSSSYIVKIYLQGMLTNEQVGCTSARCVRLYWTLDPLRFVGFCYLDFSHLEFVRVYTLEPVFH